MGARFGKFMLHFMVSFAIGFGTAATTWNQAGQEFNAEGVFYAVCAGLVFAGKDTVSLIDKIPWDHITERRTKQ